MAPHLVIPVNSDASQVGEARRHAARLGAEAGFPDVAMGRLAIVVTELAGNLIKHASNGRILLGRSLYEAGESIDVLSLDDGPGMADVNVCLRDGFSTSRTPGTGLGAVRRVADKFDIYSQAPGGTVAVARVHSVSRAPGPDEAARSNRASVADGRRFEVSGICLAAPGESISGDAWMFAQQPDGRGLLMVADGLGHGPLAAEAAQQAVDSFTRAGSAQPADLLERIHRALHGSRGAAVALACLDADRGSVVFCGAGNVAGRLISGVSDRSLLSQHGTAGLQIRRAQAIDYDWPEHALLVMFSDGITTRWNFDKAPGLLACDPMVIAGWLIRTELRGRDDATVVVVSRRAASIGC